MSTSPPALVSWNKRTRARLLILKQRLNTGKSPHTAKFAPWDLKCYVALPEKLRALNLESYLKSHSGRAFAKKRLI